jgi:MFS family permease
VPAVKLNFGALEERPFRLLWTGQAVSSFGDAAAPIALSFAVLDVTGSVSDLGIVLAAMWVTRIVLTLAGGVWADRLSRRVVMLGSDLVRAGVQALVGFLLISDRAELWHLVVASIVYGAAAAFFAPASTALVPETVSAARLQQANALMSLSRMGLAIGGPAVAGVLIAAVGTGWVFVLDAATFVVSAWSLVLLRLAPATAPAAVESFLSDLAAGWREVTGRSWVWLSIVFFGLWNLGMGPFFVLGPAIARDELGGAADWGLIMSGAAIGGAVGSALPLRLRPGRPLATGYLLTATSALQTALLIRPFPALAIAVATFLGETAVMTAQTFWVTVLQQRVPPASLSRVSAYDWLGSFIFTPVSYVVAGPLSHAIGTKTTLGIAAVVVFASSMGIALAPSIRAIRREEAHLEPAAQMDVAPLT